MKAAKHSRGNGELMTCGLDIDYVEADDIVYLEMGGSPDDITCPDCRAALPLNDGPGRIQVAPGRELHIYEATVRFVTSFRLPDGVSHAAVAIALSRDTANAVVTNLTEVTP